MVENIQIKVARAARQALDSGPDYFGEEHLFTRFGAWLDNQGWSKADSKNLLRHLHRADYRKGIPETPLAGSWALANPEPDGAHDREEKAELEAVLSEAAAPQPPPVMPWGFVISITRAGKHRKLHHMGSCHRIPGTDYHEYEVLGDRVPSEKEVDSICKNCFKQGFIFTGQEADLSEAESISSSSSSSSSGTGPPAPSTPVA